MRAGAPFWVWPVVGGVLLLPVLVCGGIGVGLVVWVVFRSSMPTNQANAAPGNNAAVAKPEVAEVVVPGITVENFARVKTGMSEVEVQAILGKPSRVGDFNQLAKLFPDVGDQPGKMNMRVLVWQKGKNQITLTFIDDKLAMTAALFPNARGGPADSVTEENFKKLKHGMTQRELLQLLGRPSFVYAAGVFLDGQGGGGTQLLWKKGRDSIDVRLDETGLVLATGAFNGKVLVLDAPFPGGLPDFHIPGGRHLTRGLYDSLKLGMSEAESLVQLGPGTPLGPQTMRNGKKSTTSWKYVDGPASITLHFVDEKLVEKEDVNLPEQ
jgi:hypothetical protein